MGTEEQRSAARRGKFVLREKLRYETAVVDHGVGDEPQHFSHLADIDFERPRVTLADGKCRSQFVDRL
ncbi:MAG TPA: hypothetical protein VFE79_09825, partial [Paraburkholderia sp.]|nr:hypothetical protein [Paraburkholderia sp.]